MSQTRLVAVSAGFEEYVSSRWARLVRSAVLMGLNVHDAEDVVQVALAKCYFSWEKVTKAVDPDAYVHRVLINSSLDSRRRKWWGERPTDELLDATVDSALDMVHDGDALRLALATLPVPQRQVVVLRFYVDLTEAQTAAVLGIAVGTVKSRASRALQALEANPTLRELTPGGDS